MFKRAPISKMRITFHTLFSISLERIKNYTSNKPIIYVHVNLFTTSDGKYRIAS